MIANKERTSAPLSILILEDQPSDAELMVRTLRRAGFTLEWQRVETEAEYLACLDPEPDLILADYSLPQFDALHALALLQARELHVPFIIVSGAIGEEVAVAAIQQGATDYLLKDRLARLGSAVTQALEQRELRIAKQRADQLLRINEQRFRALIEQAPDGIALIDLSSRFQYLSPSIQRILGYLPEEVIGRDPAELTHPDDLPRLVNQLADLFHHPGHVFTAQYQVRHKDGSWRWLESTVSNLLAESGVCAVIFNYRDITQHKRLEAQFLHAQKMESVGRLAGGVAHDFNNLLTAISGYAELIRYALPPTAEARDDLNEIVKAAGRAATLTRQLLAFASKQMITAHVLNLNDLIDNIDNLLRRLLGADIVLLTQAAADLGSVKADPGQIEQVLVNLAVNARDAMPEGGNVMIATQNVVINQTYAQQHVGVTPGSYVLVEFSDTGTGMDVETQRQIFEPFFTTKEPGYGTGLGLATCYGIVKQHGGFICVDSELQQGTTFNIYLPQVEAAIENWAQADTTSDLPRGSAVVLLVEDELAVRMFAARVLRELGYTVLEAANDVAALRIMQSPAGASVELLLMDMVMPELGSNVLTEQMTSVCPGIKVLFMSGYASDATPQLDRSGMYVVAKPFTRITLARQVRAVLDA